MSNLSAIGFPVDSPEAFAALAERAASSAEAVDAGRHGTYLRFTDGDGPELWVQASGQALIGLVPHLGGPAGMRVRVLDVVRRRDESPLDGAFRAAIDAGDGTGPVLVLDAPDFAAARDRLGPLPADAVAQIGAFALEATAYPDAVAFAEAQDGSSMPIAPRALVAIGSATDDAEPPATALLTGRIEATELRTNRTTGSAYRWARVATVGGTVEVAASPDGIDGDPAVGGVLAGVFWLSARLVAAGA